jgi:hypothetical protein
LAVHICDFPLGNRLPRFQHVHKGSFAFKAPTVVELHPNFIERYLAKIGDLISALETDVNAPKHRAAFRNVIDRIVVGEDGVLVYGRASAVMGADLFPPARSAKEILISEGVTRDDIGNAG